MHCHLTRPADLGKSFKNKDLNGNSSAIWLSRDGDVTTEHMNKAVYCLEGTPAEEAGKRESSYLPISLQSTPGKIEEEVYC